MFGFFQPNAAVVIHGPDGRHHQTIKLRLSRDAIKGITAHCPQRGISDLGNRYWKVPEGEQNWVELGGPDGSKFRVFGGSTITYISE